MEREHIFVSVFVCDDRRSPVILGYVGACSCHGWSGMRVESTPGEARERWQRHAAAEARWGPARREKLERETRQRVAAAVLERVTNPCERCGHMHMRDPVWTCLTDCWECNPELPDRSYGPEHLESLRRDAALVAG